MKKQNKYLNWDDYVKAGYKEVSSRFPLMYDGYFYICNDTIEELKYQINQQASEQKG